MKSHIGIEGNGAADEEAKKATEGKMDTTEGEVLVTEGGVKQSVFASRREERIQAGGDQEGSLIGKASYHLVHVPENRPGASGKVEKKNWENRN